MKFLILCSLFSLSSFAQDFLRLDKNNIKDFYTVETCFTQDITEDYAEENERAPFPSKYYAILGKSIVFVNIGERVLGVSGSTLSYRGPSVGYMSDWQIANHKDEYEKYCNAAKNAAKSGTLKFLLELQRIKWGDVEIVNGGCVQTVLDLVLNADGGVKNRSFKKVATPCKFD